MTFHLLISLYASINNASALSILFETPHPSRRSRTATHVGSASLDGSHVEHKTRRKRRTRCTLFRALQADGGIHGLPTNFLVVPGWHIISMPNQRLASTMQYATLSSESCHSNAESQLYSTATLRNGNFFGEIVHWKPASGRSAMSREHHYQIGYPRPATQRRGANGAARSNPQSARCS